VRALAGEVALVAEEEEEGNVEEKEEGKEEEKEEEGEEDKGEVEVKRDERSN